MAAPATSVLSTGTLDDRKFFCDLGQLILASRPLSSKLAKPRSSPGNNNNPAGGGKGPVAPTMLANQKWCHEIAKTKLQLIEQNCPPVDGNLVHLHKLFDHKVALCIELILQPRCTHCCSYLLIERWCINVSPKRSEKHICRKSLYQALTSYLHFSQLSAWICKYKSKEMPSDISYRISPPGEFCTKSFGEPITRHEFPEATAMPSAPPSATQKTFKITVESIARRDDMPVVDCAMCERLSLSPSTSPITPPATPPSTPLSASPPRLSNFIPPPLVKAPPPAPIVRIPASSPASSSSMTRGAAAVSRYLGGLSRPLTSTSLTTPDRHGSLGAGLKLTPPSSTLVASPNSLFTPLTSGSACHLTPKSLTPLPDERRRPLDPSINQISQFTCPVKRSRLNNNNDCTEIDDLSRMEIAETSEVKFYSEFKHESLLKSKCIRNIFNIKKPVKSNIVKCKSTLKSVVTLQSSPAPIKRKTSQCFDYDESLNTSRAIKNSISCVNFTQHKRECQLKVSSSSPALTSRLLGSFEESLLNGCIEPTSIINGFKADLSASGNFNHISLDVNALFYTLNDDDTPSPYLCHIPLESLGKRGYQIPPSGTIQLTLFNPNDMVVKMFVIVYDLSEMPSSATTFLRQRTLYTPVDNNDSGPSFLRYLIHLRCTSSASRRIYLHTDIRIIVGQDKFEFHSQVANYELRSFTEYPRMPQFSDRE